MKNTVLKCVQLLEKNGFLDLTRSENRIKSFGSLGLKVTTNLVQKLTDFYNRCPKTNVFPVGSLSECGSTFSDLLQIKSEDDQRLKKESYIVFTSPEVSDEGQISIKSDVNTFLCFSPKTESLKDFFWFQSNRHRWWRKFSASPSRFKQSDIKQLDSSPIQELTIDFEINNQRLLLERISYSNNEALKSGLQNFEDHDVIQCQVYPQAAVVAYLLDSFKWQAGSAESDWSLALHEALTPFQVAIALDDTSGSRVIQDRLTEIASFVAIQLEETNIAVFPEISCETRAQDKFTEFDKIGIPFTIVLSDTLVNKGIINVRNRDTKLFEQVHISNIKTTLMLYLRMVKPIDVPHREGLKR